MKDLIEFDYEYIENEFVFAINLECDRIIGLVDKETANEICGSYDDIFPVCFEHLISPDKMDCIMSNKIASKDKIIEHIHEEWD